MSPRLRTLLVLGRVSNLPTIWSNCLTGWWLGGGGNYWKLPVLLLGASALYTGGMFLNDAFDADFDRQGRPTRPIPAGAITRESVWVWSFGLLVAGALALAVLGKTAAVLTLAWLVCILIYGPSHKVLVVSPWLMGLCRFWIYVIAGSTGVLGLNGGPLWCGVALAIYVAGVSSLGWRRRFRGPVQYWPLLMLAAPILLALLMNTGEARKAAMLLSFLLVLWTARSVRSLFPSAGEVNVGRIVSGLFAGIVLVDWLAVGPQLPHWLSGVVFLPLLGATLLLQRFAPEA
jgi:hypothetical protein